MPEETHVIRGINWRETFPFTNIFRSFRVAIHPSKLILALLAILLIYIAGRLLDGMTPAQSRGIPNEIEYYESFRGNRLIVDEKLAMPPTVNAIARKQVEANGSFTDFRRDARQEMEKAYVKGLMGMGIKGDKDKPVTEDEATEAAKSGKYLDTIKDKMVEERDKQVKRLNERHDGEHGEKDAAANGYFGAAHAAWDAYFAAVDSAEAQGRDVRDSADKLTDSKAREDARNKANDDEAKAITAAREKRDKSLTDAKNAAKTKYDALKGEDKEKEDARRKEDRKKVEDEYTRNTRVIYGDVAEGWEKARHIRGEGLYDQFMDYEIGRVNDVVGAVLSNNWMGGLTPESRGLALGGSPGVFASALRFFVIGPRWAVGQHPVYFTVMGIIFLIVWALFGGAIARVAAVHVAREEKLSMRQGLRFSSGKFLSFLFAPIIPIAIIIFVGLIVALGGLLLYVPFVGPILVGVFFFLALAAGFVMTLVALGTFGGLNLMYPTIAAEGSDSFDAISRSFSYVYARPWRMLWYTVVAIFYGAITFVFVRLFIWLTLAFTHYFVGLALGRTTDGEQNLWGAMWPGSTMWHLPYHVDYISLSFGQRVAAFFVAFWVFLVIAFLGAYLISYYFSSSMVIYYLMRREVDATELDDVYVEQSDDDFAEPMTAVPSGAPGVPVGPAAAVETTTVTPTPAVSLPPPGEGAPPPSGI